MTVHSFWERWTTDPLFARPKESSDIRRRELTKSFAERYRDVPIIQVGDEIVADWLAGGSRAGSVQGLCSMFKRRGISEGWSANRPQRPRSVCPRDPWPLSIMSDTIDRLDDPNVRFARSATRHSISKDHIRHVIANYRVRFQEPPPETDSARPRATRVVYLGDDDRGRALEVMGVGGKRGELLVIHAMELRDKYRKRYEDRK